MFLQLDPSYFVIFSSQQMKYKLYKIQRESKYAEESKVVKTQYLVAPTHQSTFET